MLEEFSKVKYVPWLKNKKQWSIINSMVVDMPLDFWRIFSSEWTYEKIGKKRNSIQTKSDNVISIEIAKVLKYAQWNTDVLYTWWVVFHDWLTPIRTCRCEGCLHDWIPSKTQLLKKNSPDITTCSFEPTGDFYSIWTFDIVILKAFPSTLRAQST